MMMGSARSFTGDVRKTIVNESRHEFIDHAVVGFSSIFASRDELEMTKKRELVAHRRHRQPERVREIADAELFVSERVHQPQTKRIGQGEEDFDRFSGGLLGRQ